MMRYKSGKTEKNMKTKNDEITDDNTKEVVEREDDNPVNTTAKTSHEEESVKPVEQVEEVTSDETVDEAIPIADNASGSNLNDDLQLKINDLNDRYLRLYSEFDNYRKRTIKERIEMSKTASEDVIRALLPIVDDFDRAIKSWDLIDADEAHLEGIKLIYNKLQNTLTQRGLEEITSIGLPFNTDFHEAITQIPAPTPELKDKIVDVVEKGYLLQGKVIRFAKVVVGS
jgi:molecular chaperone GrpE